MVANFVALGLLVGDRSRPQRRCRGSSRRSACRCAGSSRTAWPRARAACWPSARTCRPFAPTTIWCGRNSACRPTAAVAISTTRACSRRCARFRAAPSTIAADCRSRATMPTDRGKPRPSTSGSATSSTTRARIPPTRCYPAGPIAFHVLGDAKTRSNWSAANTSYVERDAEDLLRGFDDRARPS